MNAHIICFRREISKQFTRYPLLTRTMDMTQKDPQRLRCGLNLSTLQIKTNTFANSEDPDETACYTGFTLFAILCKLTDFPICNNG